MDKVDDVKNTVLTLGEAAKMAGVAKTTITNAIKKGKLSAALNDNGSYNIELIEFFRAYPNARLMDSPEKSTLDKMDSVKKPNGHSNGRETSRVLQVELDASRRECRDLKERLAEAKEVTEDARSERDGWKDQAKTMQRLLEHKPENPPARMAKKSAWIYVFLGVLILAVTGLLADRFGLISLLNIVTE